MSKKMSQLLYPFNFCLVVFMLAVVSSGAYAQESVSGYAGSIVYSTGDVVAVNADGETRPLGRRTDIFIGDTVYTGPASSAQLSMIDSAQVVLAESTAFQITEYAYQSNENDSVVLKLLEGGFRTVTGKVAKDRYRSDINGFSSIGIRGTEYEARIVESDRLVVALYDGGVTLSNLGGALDLGLGADYDFAEVRSLFVAPVGLDELPTELDVLQFLAAAVAGTVDTLDPNDNLIAAINPDLAQAPSANVDGQVVNPFDVIAALAANGTGDAAASPAGQSGAVAEIDTFRSATFGSVRRLTRSVDTNLVNGVAQDVSGLASTVEFLDDAVALELPALLDAEIDVASNLLELAGQTTATLTEVEIPLQEISLLAVLTTTVQNLSVEDPTAIIDVVDAVDLASIADVITELPSDLVQQPSDVVTVVETPNPVEPAIEPVAPVDVVGQPPAVDIVPVGGVTVPPVVAGGDLPDTTIDPTVPTTPTVPTVPTVPVVTVVVDDPPTTDTDTTTTEPESEPEIETPLETLTDIVMGESSLFAMKRPPQSDADKVTKSVAWGAWNTPVPEHISQALTISAGDYSVDLTPTSVGNLTGSYQYSNVVGYEGHGSAGELTNVAAGFDVDFNTGMITNGMLSVAVEANQNWLLGFDGMVERGVVDLNSLGGTLTEFLPLLDTITPIDGDLSGAFTGSHGATFIGGFELLDVQNPMNTVEGIYTLER